MNLRLKIVGLLGLAAAASMTACTTASSGMGPDTGSGSQASAVTWSDGQPAIAISCNQPGGCQERANAVCKNGPYKTLKSENMPVSGATREVQRPSSVVIRCG